MSKKRDRENWQKFYGKNKKRLNAKSRAYYDATYPRRRLLGQRSYLSRTAEVRAYIQDHKKAHPCIDCGERDPVVLEFDHKNPKTKLFNVGRALGLKKTLAEVKCEIRKCVMRCANDHRRHTVKQRAAGIVVHGPKRKA